MTAVPDWDIGRPMGTDAELVRASAAGDRSAFAGIYDRYSNRLHDFCVGMLRDRDGAADCVQDVFCIAATRLPQLREPDKLRPWLYTIARNEALRRIRERRRETISDQLPDQESHEPGPDTLAARTELAGALGVSQTNANTMVHRLRETIERSLGALLVSRRARNNPDRCPELASILDGWDGHFTVLMRKRIARHIESCPTCDQERRRLVSPVALLGGVPVFIPAPTWLREQTLSEIQLVSMTTPLAGKPDHRAGSSTTNPDDDARSVRTRSSLLPVALFLATLIAALGLTIVWLNLQKTTTITRPRSVKPRPYRAPPHPPHRLPRPPRLRRHPRRPWTKPFRLQPRRPPE